MKNLRSAVLGTVFLIISASAVWSQQNANSAGDQPAGSTSQLPRLVRFSGTLKDVDGSPLTGITGVTFALYSEQAGGAPLWLETQNITADSNGHYAALLGSTKPDGLPAELFTSEQARWVGVQVSGQAEQARVLLVSAPYALKAGDAETVGGLPASAFVLAAPPVAASGNAETNATGNVAASSAAAAQALTSSDVTTTGGTVNTIPLFTTATNIQNSILTQTSTTAINVRGKLNLPATGTATSSKGFPSQPADLTASAFNSATSAAVPQTFQWQAEPVGNNTSTATGSLNLLFGQGTSKPSETGLNIASNGQITFAKGQAFPGTGDGTVTSVGSGAGLTGGPITGSGTLSIPTGGVSNAMLANSSLNVTAGTDLTGGGSVTLGGGTTLNLDTTKVPQLNAANTFTGNQTVSGNLSATGVVTGSSYQIGSNLFAFGSYANKNAFLGFAGNSAMTGTGNTATGLLALPNNTTGAVNTATGFLALQVNSSGGANTADGEGALGSNNGSANTATGALALDFNGAGSLNTAIGYQAGITTNATSISGSNNTFVGSNSAVATGTLTNATAIGANAEVAESNAMVLGEINGVNNATASTNVGIGTTAPTHTLEVYSEMATTAQMAMITDGTDAAFSLNNTASGGEEYWIDSGSGAAGVGAGNFAIYDRTKGLTRLVVTQAGNVGIGTTSPDNPLSVMGSADKTGGGSWGSFSDGRLKNLNGSFSSGLSQVLKIHPVRYRYKADNPLGIRDTDEHIGVVAQEVRQVIPEAVTENSKGYLLVNNDPIIWSMLNAIKEQQREIQQQQAALRTQATAIRNLRSELRATRQSAEDKNASSRRSARAELAPKPDCWQRSPCDCPHPDREGRDFSRAESRQKRNQGFSSSTHAERSSRKPALSEAEGHPIPAGRSLPSTELPLGLGRLSCERTPVRARERSSEAGKRPPLLLSVWR